ncbi:hypothetical protein NDU88_007550 [Pleurodeles waltl]|uniref:Uncharacterized protein n=1 Tax=Pleurodeles waltl TaxID=8319 RepID=A0AAV7NWK4_PLEWA|nr:hypothetical protein NDU88_007550 [Pleurodeles waltl]
MTHHTATILESVPTPSKAWQKHITEDQRLPNKETEKLDAAMEPELQVFPMLFFAMLHLEHQRRRRRGLGSRNVTANVLNRDGKGIVCLGETHMQLHIIPPGGHSDRGGRRPPSGSRRKTAARSKDRSGHSGFPTGPAGDRQKTAGRPSGTAPSTMKPARNGAGGVEGVRRVQWHPLRFSLSAKQTVKIFVGPC